MNKLRPLCLIVALALAATSCRQQRMPDVLSMRQRAEIADRWLETRLDTVIPDLMRRENVSMWIVGGREYNEDPVLRTMLPATWLSARRRTILLFHDWGPARGVERLAVARYDIGPFVRAWDPQETPDQWERLAEIVAERDPETIAVNVSPTFALADGLSASERDALEAALPGAYAERLVSGERLAVGWLETRIPAEMDRYAEICRIAHVIIREGFSEQVVTPGVTTTDDMEWWYRQRIRELDLVTWFHPSVSVQRASAGGRGPDFSAREGPTAIERGDLLHVDFGITYLGLNTDTQQHAYVLLPEESEAPEGLRRALSAGNRLQDLLTDSFAEGRSGNDILRLALQRAREDGLRAAIYTHPIGFHGHGAGPTIGLWDRQHGVPGRGDYPLFANTAHSIELNVLESVPEFNDLDVRIMLEEDAFFDGEHVRWIDGRQTELWLIR